MKYQLSQTYQAFLESKEELKEMGYNKYGRLDMTIENIPRIKEEIERFEKREPSFSAATI